MKATTLAGPGNEAGCEGGQWARRTSLTQCGSRSSTLCDDAQRIWVGRTIRFSPSPLICQTTCTSTSDAFFRLVPSRSVSLIMSALRPIGSQPASSISRRKLLPLSNICYRRLIHSRTNFSWVYLRHSTICRHCCRFGRLPALGCDQPRGTTTTLLGSSNCLCQPNLSTKGRQDGEHSRLLQTAVFVRILIP